MAYHHSPNRGTGVGLPGNQRLGSSVGPDCSGDERESRSGGEERLDVDLQDKPTYLLEHLATFTVNKESGIVYPADGMRRLLQLEKTTGIWSQKMQLCLDYKWVLIMDYETGNIIERFPASLIQEPTAFTSTDAMELYNNILVFIVSGGSGSRSEMHIFQSQSVSAVHLVEDLKILRNGKTVTHQREPVHLSVHSNPQPHNSCSHIGLQKSNVSSNMSVGLNNRSDEHQHQHQHQYTHHRQQHRSNSIIDHYDTSGGGGTATAETDSEHGGFNDESSSTSSDKYERDVTVLNHCFDDIEKFIARLQHAAAASRELERRRRNRKSKKKDPGEGLLTLRTRPPHEKEFIDIFAKFKLSFNLLAKLKAHIHDPNAPELVHFLFTPLALIVEAASDTYYEAQLPSHVTNPLLTREAINLLINCVTSKETELWRSLGDAWIIPRDEWKEDIGSSYHPVFLDGWSPDYVVVDELEQPTTPVALPKRLETATVHHHQGNNAVEHNGRSGIISAAYNERHSERNTLHPDNVGMAVADFSNRSEISIDSIERNGLGVNSSTAAPYNSTAIQSLTSGMQNLYTTTPNDNNNPRMIGLSSDDQMLEAWLDELQGTGAKIVIVTYPRTANNDKELSVVRGEYLEILDDSRKWWKARNVRGQIAHVPHTIVAPYNYGENDGNINQFYGQQQNKASADNRSTDTADWIKKKHQEHEPNVRTKLYTQSSQHEYAIPMKLKTSTPNEVPKSGKSILRSSQSHTNYVREPSAALPIDSEYRYSSYMKKNKTKNFSNMDISVDSKENHTASNKNQNTLAKDNTDPDHRLMKTTTPYVSNSLSGGIQEELRNVLRKRTHRTPTMCIDGESSSSEVANWLRTKEFSPAVVQCLKDYSGEDFLALTIGKLEETFGQEGRRLASQIQLQKISGYKTARSIELQTAFARIRSKVEYQD